MCDPLEDDDGFCEYFCCCCCGCFCLNGKLLVDSRLAAKSEEQEVGLDEWFEVLRVVEVVFVVWCLVFEVGCSQEEGLSKFPTTFRWIKTQ